MAELCLMASNGYPPGIVLHPEQGFPRVSKDFLPLFPSVGTMQEKIRASPLNLRSQESDHLWKTMTGHSDANPFIRIDSTIRRPMLVDVQDGRPDALPFCFETAERSTRIKKILQLLMSEPNEVERDGLDLSTLFDLTGLESLSTHTTIQQPFDSNHSPLVHEGVPQPSLVNPYSQFQTPLLELLGDLTYNSEMELDGQVTSEMKNMLSIIAEFNLTKNSTKWTKQSVLVPHFSWWEISEARGNIRGSSMQFKTVEFAPMKSPHKIKLKPSPKRKSHHKKAVIRESDFYRKNNVHACETLMSIMINKRRHGKTTILSLKKSGPELHNILTQFSASIAGTGIALLFSVICKVVACGGGRVPPFCASKLLNTSLGFGLVWLSWAVKNLGNTIVHISKNSGKLGRKEEQMMRKLDRNVSDIFFRAATLMVVAVLRLA